MESRGLLSERYFGRVNLYYALRRDRLEDPDNELGFNTGSQTGFFDSCGGDFLSQYAPDSPLQQMLKLNISASIERYSHRDSPDSGGDVRYPTQRRIKTSAALEDEMVMWNDRLFISPQARYEIWHDSFVDEGDFGSGTGERKTQDRGAPAWQMGLRWYPVKDRFYLKGSVGQAVRIPTFTEFFGDRGYIIGNPDLEHERSLNSEGGAGITLEKGKGILQRALLECVFFRNIIYDYIALIYNSQYTLKPQNIGRAEINGCELAASADMLSHLSMSANYTFQRAINKGNLPSYHNKYLPHRPLHEASGRVKIFNSMASLSYEISYTGFNFMDPYNTESYFIDYRIVHNLEARVEPLEMMTVTFEIKNFTDNHVSDVYNTPLPGRSYYLPLGYALQ
jgi:iron complex outermembrane receptor protein